jgi:hypothetical protein
MNSLKIDKSVPFFGNTEDGIHCFEANIRMVAKYFWPERDYSWEEIDKITTKTPGLWTWPQAGWLWLESQGIEMTFIEDYDYAEFAKLGNEYLIKHYGEDVAQIQIENSNIPQEQKVSQKFIEKISVEQRIPTIQDITEFLQQNYLVMCNVNSMALNGKPGFMGHFVLIKGIEGDQFILHDPGLPPLENRRVDFATFEKGWASPDQKAKNLAAVRMKR